MSLHIVRLYCNRQAQVSTSPCPAETCAYTCTYPDTYTLIWACGPPRNLYRFQSAKCHLGPYIYIYIYIYVYAYIAIRVDFVFHSVDSFKNAKRAPAFVEWHLLLQPRILETRFVGYAVCEFSSSVLDDIGR